MVKKILFFSICLLAGPLHAEPYLKRQDVQKFIRDFSEKHKQPTEKIETLFSKVETDPKVIELMNQQSEKLGWHDYRKIFLTKKHIQGGVHFMKNNKNSLERAQIKYGVPPEIITAILGVETLYGKNLGNFPILRSLATLSFDFPKRAEFFKKELEHFLLIVEKDHEHALQMKGSYAGAFGMAQFIPSSYRYYAVDFSGQGKKDIIHNADDAIGSIAFYFKKHGWELNKPICTEASFKESEHDIPQLAKATEFSSQPKPVYSLKKLQEFGINTKSSSIDTDTLAILLELNSKSNQSHLKEHWLGFHNFFVITRYNHSSNYAMAVFQLSDALLKASQKSDS